MKYNKLIFCKNGHLPIIYFLLQFVIFSSDLRAQSIPKKKDWIQLFNGKDLKDWTPKIAGFDLGDNYGNTFRVKDRKMVVSYDLYQNFDRHYGHIFYKNPYSWYLISLEYRFTGKQAPGGEGWAWRNSGIMIHGQDPHTMLKNQDFPISIEVQLLGGPDSGSRSTANLCTPGTDIEMGGKRVTDHCINSSSQTYRGDQWVRVDVLVMGDSLIKHIVNGDTVLTYSKPQIGGGVVNNFDPAVKIDGRPVTGGYISLQSESHPVEFRKVALLNLEGCMDPKAKNYRSYYLKADNSKCKY